MKEKENTKTREKGKKKEERKERTLTEPCFAQKHYKMAIKNPYIVLN